MTYLPEFLTVVAVHLLAAMSPGPDFVLVSRNSLVYSRKAAVYTAVGLGFGILVHVTYSLIGIGLLIAKSIFLFSALKFIGAGYLIYIGAKSLRAKTPQTQIAEIRTDQALGALAAIRMGFLTNVFNPKATLFFLALFTQVINPHTPKFIQVLYGLEMSLMTFAWFALVAATLSQNSIKARVASIQQRLEHVFGAILIALGVKVALSSSK